MYFDDYLKFSSAQAVTSAAASTNYVNLGAVRNIGVGENLYVVTVVTTAMTDTGSNSTLTVDLYGDSTSTFTPDGTDRCFIIPAVSAAGYMAVARVNPNFASNYQYLELYYTPNNGDLSAGAFTSFLALDVAQYSSYADNVTIS